MIVEIPRWTNAKLEISSSEPLNPIQQVILRKTLAFLTKIDPPAYLAKLGCR
jgi:inorganic pyrophosphatase